MIEVLDGAVGLAFGIVGHAAHVERQRIVGPPVDRLVQIEDGAFVVALLERREAAAVVGRRIAGIDTDRLLVVGESR